MESFVKRYFWIVNLLMLAGIAFLAALVINNLLAEQIVSLETSTATQKKTSKVSKRTDPRAGEWAELIVDRNIFNSEPPAPKSDEPDGGAGGDGGEERDPALEVSMIARRAMRRAAQRDSPGRTG